MNYGRIIGRSVHVALKNRFLFGYGTLFWLFGGPLLITISPYLFAAIYPEDLQLSDLDIIEGFLVSIQIRLPIIIVAVLLSVCFGFITLYLGSLAEGALVSTINSVEINGDNSLSAKEGWRAALPHATDLVLIAIYTRVPQGFVILIAAMYAVLGMTDAETIATGLLSTPNILVVMLCANIIVSIPVTIARLFAVRSCIIERLPAAASIRRSVKIMLQQAVAVTGATAISYVVGSLLTLLTSLVIFILIVTCIGVLAVPFIGGVATTILLAYWTLVWLELSPKTALSTMVTAHVS